MDIPSIDELRGYSEDSLLEAAFTLKMTLKVAERLDPANQMEQEKKLLRDIQSVLSEKSFGV